MYVYCRWFKEQNQGALKSNLGASIYILVASSPVPFSIYTAPSSAVERLVPFKWRMEGWTAKPMWPLTCSIHFSVRKASSTAWFTNNGTG